MATPWYRRVRQGGKLTVFGDPLLDKGSWHGLLPQAIKELNTELGKQKVNVQFEISDDKPRISGDGANVWVRVESGSFDLNFQNRKEKDKIDGRDLHGATHLWIEESRKGSEVVKAYVILPLNPQVNRDSKPRAAGAPILKVILAHELMHSCGLSNDDHTSDDIFVGVQNAESPGKPEDDRLKVMKAGQWFTMPPLFLSETVAKLNKIW